MPQPLSALQITFGRFLSLAAAVLCAGVLGGCKGKPAQSAAAPGPDVWAMVDGREVRRSDVEKAYLRVAQAPPTASPEEGMAAKLNILNELIVQDLLVARAGALGISVTDTDIDAAFADRKKNISDEAFQKELSQRNLTAADMRDGLRREMLMQKVLDREVTSKIAVSDQDITAFYEGNRGQFNFPETSYRIAQIVVTPVRDAEVTNRSNDDATTPEAATQKTQMLMERLKGGTSFAELAADFSEDPRSAPQGGDLGFVPLSALKQAPPVLRDTVLKMTPGSVNHVVAGGGHTLVLLVAKEEAGQRDLNTPGVKDSITSTLRGRREQLLRSAYLTAAAADANVVNYLARQVVQAQGKVAGTGATAAPAKP